MSSKHFENLVCGLSNVICDYAWISRTTIIQAIGSIYAFSSLAVILSKTVVGQAVADIRWLQEKNMVL